MKNRSTGRLSGFTLIELLVVVLIIGVLTAIALPQYQKAVAKARFTDVLIRIKALADAQERYFLANGEYSNDYLDLDVNVVPEDSGMVIGGTKQRDFFCYNGGCYYINDGKNYIWFWGSSGNAKDLPEVYMGLGVNAGQRICCFAPYSSSETTIALCKGAGGQKATAPTPGRPISCYYF